MAKPDRIRSAWWAVLARFLIHGLVISSWVSRIPSVKESLRLSDGTLGISLLGTAIGCIRSVPVAGWLVNRHGSKHSCSWSSIGLCLALILPALSFDAVSLFGALFFLGAMAGWNDVSMNAQAVAVEKAGRRPTMSRFHAMFSIGGIIGASAGGLMAARGWTPLAHFAGASAAILIFAILSAPAMFDTRVSTVEAQSAHAVSFRRIPLALLFLSAIGFCIFLSEGAIADWTAVYLKQSLGAGAGVAALGYATFSAFMALFRLCGDAITVRLGPAWTMRGGGLIAAFGLGSALLVHSPYLALPGFAMAGAGFSSIIPLVFGAGGRTSPAGEGSGVATVSGLGYLGFLAGPPAIGLLSEISTLRVALLFVVALSATAALLVSAVERTGGKLTLEDQSERHAAAG